MHRRWISSIFALALFGLPSLVLAQESGASAILGFNDLTFKNDYITSRGLLATNQGFTIQSVNGLVSNTYHNTDAALSEPVASYQYFQRVTRITPVSAIGTNSTGWAGSIVGNSAPVALG
jgi:hypothetical protein